MFGSDPILGAMTGYHKLTAEHRRCGIDWALEHAARFPVIVNLGRRLPDASLPRSRIAL